MSRNLLPKSGFAAPVAEPEKPKYRFDPDTERRFMLRRHIGTPEFSSFNNLWELSILDKKGNIERIVVDADALPNCFDWVAGEFDEMGF